MRKTRAAGNWNFDMDKAPKDGSVVLLLSCNGVPLSAFWSKYKVPKESEIIYTPNKPPELVEAEGWMASVGPGLILVDPMVAWAAVYIPDMKFKDSPFGNNGQTIPHEEVEKQKKKEKDET
jgi:hypothetical protein